MSSTVVLSALWDALGVPSTKAPIDATTLVSYVLPPVVCYFVVAILAVKPQTRAVRVALWPIVALLALRAAVSVDMSLGRPERGFFNIDFVMAMCYIATQTLDWALAKEQLVRHLRPTNASPSTIMDALDLSLNLRGYGWNWSGGVYIPRETRPTNRITFALRALFSVVVHALICVILQQAILTFAPVGAGSIPKGSSIFDETLPFLVRYLRACIISTLAAFGAYAILQTEYDLCTVLGILIFGQDPSQWPPPFDAPWRATSLSDFWGKRWHQWFRRQFLFTGGYPLSFVLGRTGIVIGTFLASAVSHHIMITILDGQMESWRMLIGFGMMASGILAERAFHQLTGRRVGGVVGWVWTMSWLLLCGNVIIDGFSRATVFGCTNSIDNLLPMQVLVERLVVNFDVWLHSI